MINTNYLFVLYRKQHKLQIKHQFKIYDLLSAGLSCETTYNLHDLVPSHHKYGSFNKGLEFVSFTQCSPLTYDLCTFDIFSVHFMTKNGDIYLLNPVLMQVMIFREDHFSQILVMLNNLQDEERDKTMLKHFRMFLIQGKESVKERPNFCSVKISDLDICKLEAAL